MERRWEVRQQHCPCRESSGVNVVQKLICAETRAVKLVIGFFLSFSGVVFAKKPHQNLTLFKILNKTHWKVFLGSKNVVLCDKSKKLFSVGLNCGWLVGFCCTLNASEHLHQLHLGTPERKGCEPFRNFLLNL